ncbi:Probable Co/Zn/Cd efflux system membrane fusion protein [Olavius algarvensis associated proteobacterium Delta 3]|nr:Probable Co/Zn/Cd efflux system membrane fusion protein [Olavius algarvensis associated proteobacterium Delta 3]CAB5149475.1 Probable Co/Zn/Cd efflux system membrane fusion protein [Olavius algarvensis associated proteobacterium Delta 3]
MTRRHKETTKFRVRVMAKMAVVLGLFSGPILIGCSEKIGPGHTGTDEAMTIQATVAVAHFQTHPFIYDAVGTVAPRIASTIGSKLMGTVKAVNVQEGDRVREGDVLLVLDQRQVSAQLQQAEAAFAEAQRAEASARSARESAVAAAKLAKGTYDRYMKLLRDRSASQQEFDVVEAKYRQAEATLTQTSAMLEAAGHRVEQAKAGMAAARVGKKDATVRAPYDGKIAAKMINVGDLASPGTPFFGMEKEGVYCAELVLPEEHIGTVHLDQVVLVVIPALDDKPVEGRIGRIVPTADERSRSFQVKVALPENPAIRSGMFARVEVPVGEAGMLLIPSSAVLQRGQLTGIYLVDEEQIARFRLIRTGKAFGDSVEVLSGLKDGDRFVVSPPLTMVDGARVEASS